MTEATFAGIENKMLADSEVHLHVQRKEGEVREEGVAAGRGDQVPRQRLGAARVLAGQHRRRPVHHLLHVAAHPVQRQVVRRLPDVPKPQYSVNGPTSAQGEPAEVV